MADYYDYGYDHGYHAYIVCADRDALPPDVDQVLRLVVHHGKTWGGGYERGYRDGWDAAHYDRV